MITNENIDLINELFDNKQYTKCLEECEDIITRISKQNIKTHTDKIYLGKAYYNIGRIYIKEKNYENAMNNAYKSLDYCYDDIQRVKTYWILGLCYKNKDNKQKALMYYDECLNIFEEHELKLQYYDILSNKGNLLQDETLTLEALKYYTENKYNDKIQRRYEDLFYIYLNKNIIFKAKYFLSQISDEKLHIKLQDILDEEVNTKDEKI